VSGKRFFHVSASFNRASIREHGLDWSRMGTTGIAGALKPEQEGVFLCRGFGEAEWFASFGQVRPVDVWEVDATGLEVGEVEFDGHLFFPGTIPPERLKLVDVRVPSKGHDSVSLPREDGEDAPALHETRSEHGDPWEDETEAPPGAVGSTYGMMQVFPRTSILRVGPILSSP
jgi:hypothetical protein